MEGKCIQLVGITPNQLQDAISKDFAAQLREFKKSLQSNTPDEILTRSETAKLLKINLSTLYLWTKKGKIKSFGISGKVYYKRSEVESALVRL
jgi:DNA invertase Pin-like site-specific DNA recombinase